MWSMCTLLLACPAIPLVQVVGPILDLGDGEPLAGVQVCLLEGVSVSRQMGMATTTSTGWRDNGIFD